MIQQSTYPPNGLATTSYPHQIDGLDISAAEDGYIIYQPERDCIHYLNPTAVLIMELCNGRNSQDRIAELLKQAYDLGDAPIEVVHQALMTLASEGLLRPVRPVRE